MGLSAHGTGLRANDVIARVEAEHDRAVAEMYEALGILNVAQARVESLRDTLKAIQGDIAGADKSNGEEG